MLAGEIASRGEWAMTRRSAALRSTCLTGIMALNVVMGAWSITVAGGASSPSNQAPVATSTPTQVATQAPTASATSTPTPQANVIGGYSNAVAVGANSSGTASVSCPNGEPLL